MATEPLFLTTLGRVSLAGYEVTSKRLLPLVYMVREVEKKRDTVLSSLDVAEMIWQKEKKSIEKAQSSFREARHKIRQAVGLDLLDTASSDRAIDKVVTDVRLLLIACRAKNSQTIKSLYRGVFLKNLGNTPQFEQWINDERTFINQSVWNTFLYLATQHPSSASSYIATAIQCTGGFVPMDQEERGVNPLKRLACLLSQLTHYQRKLPKDFLEELHTELELISLPRDFDKEAYLQMCQKKDDAEKASSSQLQLLELFQKRLSGKNETRHSGDKNINTLHTYLETASHSSIANDADERDIEIIRQKIETIPLNKINTIVELFQTLPSESLHDFLQKDKELTKKVFWACSRQAGEWLRDARLAEVVALLEPLVHQPVSVSRERQELLFWYLYTLERMTSFGTARGALEVQDRLFQVHAELPDETNAEATNIMNHRIHALSLTIKLRTKKLSEDETVQMMENIHPLQALEDVWVYAQLCNLRGNLYFQKIQSTLLETEDAQISDSDFEKAIEAYDAAARTWLNQITDLEDVNRLNRYVGELTNIASVYDNWVPRITHELHHDSRRKQHWEEKKTLTFKAYKKAQQAAQRYHANYLERFRLEFNHNVFRHWLVLSDSDPLLSEVKDNYERLLEDTSYTAFKSGLLRGHYNLAELLDEFYSNDRQALEHLDVAHQLAMDIHDNEFATRVEEARRKIEQRELGPGKHSP